MWEIICSDIMTWCKEYAGPKFHALLTDCPYEMKFMGKVWDGTGISFQKETWAALAEYLLPGGFLFVFASSRGWHRLACALEDAGLIIQPSIFNWQTGEVTEVPFCLGWLTGQSFPKSTRIDTAIDKAAGKLGEREVVGKSNTRIGPSMAKTRPTWQSAENVNWREANNITLPATDLARAWEGHRYGGQILKNALEPIIVAQKPWEGKRLDCIVETGAGSLWVDGARVGLAGMEEHRTPAKSGLGKHGIYGKSTVEILEGKDLVRYSSKGRWPSNFCLIHSPECKRVMIEEPCQTCNGSGTVEAEPIMETWGEWYAKTKDYGGTREEYDRLASPGGSAFCKECEGSGEVRRVGVKRVKSESGGDSGKRNSDQFLGAIPSNDMMLEGRSYADPDGMETVDAWDCSSDCPARKLGEQSGEGEKSYRYNPSTQKGSKFHGNKGTGEKGYNDKGTAARFFYQADWEYECAENCPIARLDEQGKQMRMHGAGSRKASTERNETKSVFGVGSGKGVERIGDSGGPSRFYMNADWSHEVAEWIAGADPVRYCPKSAKRERNQNLDDFYWRKDKQVPIGFVRIDKDEWEALGEEEERIKEETGKRVSLRAWGNIHSTVKPISLLVWLCRLLSPPKEYTPRRLLVPFSGSGSEVAAAVISGCWEEVVGIEINEDYCSIAEARVEFWSAKMQEIGSSDPKAILKACGTKKRDSSDENSTQMPLELL